MTIKNTIMGLAVVAALTSCASHKPADNRFTLTIETPAVSDNSMAYLMNFDLDTKADSAVVTDGRVVFAGEVNKPFMGRLVVNGKRGAMMVVEPGVITVDASGNAAGSPTNTAAEAFSSSSAALEARYKALPATATEAERQAVVDEYEALNRSTMEANINNPFGAYLFLQQAYDMTPEQLTASVAKYPALVEYPRVKKVMDTFARKEATSAGKMFTDFVVEYDGNVSRLSDYVGKGDPVLVDFWASWCGPCRRESVVLKDLYARYHHEGLQVLGVAVWDEPENSLEAIEELQLPWPNIINGQTGPTDLYGILGIPCIIMFDGDGRIMFRDLQGDELRAAVAEAMEQNAKAQPL